MSRLALRIAPAASNDLDELWYHIALDNISAADHQLRRIAHAFDQLASFPHSGPQRQDLAPDARALTLDRYIILYRVDLANVDIIRVLPAMRDLPSLVFLPVGV